MFEVFGCGNSSHFAVRFPVRVQALDNKLGHLQAGRRELTAQYLRKGSRSCTEDIKWKRQQGELADPSLFLTRLAGLDRRMPVCQLGIRQKDPESALRGRASLDGLSWPDVKQQMEALSSGIHCWSHSSPRFQ